MRDADSVLVIGGTQTSYHAGIAAMVAGKPVVPVGSFGGAGLMLLDLLETTSLQFSWLPTVRAELKALRGSWTRFRLSAVLRFLRVGDFPRLLLVHGRSADWKDLRQFLVAQLSIPEPVVMEEVYPDSSRTLPEKFEQIARPVDGAIVVATPDDVGALGAKEGQPGGRKHLEPRARQNVWLEMGWIWGALGRRRILPLKRGEIEIPSDIQGLEWARYKVSPAEAGPAIRSFIESLWGQ
jgi:hypothetical protein